MGGTGLFVLSLLFIGNASSEKVKPEKPKDEFTVTPVVLPNERKPETPQQNKVQPAAPKLAKQEVFTTQLKVVNDIVDPLATQKDLENIGIGNIKVEGPPTTGIPTPPQLITGNGRDNSDKASDKNEAALPSRQPQFPGGPVAWLHFLNKHLRPPQNLEPGEKRMSHIRFLVDEEGDITNFHIVQSGGSEFDNEVIRVLKKMPKWLPALQNGKAISVSFTQPVTFVAGEE